MLLTLRKCHFRPPYNTVADHKQTVRQLMSYYNYNLAKNESYIMGRHQWTIGTFKGYGAVMTDKSVHR